MNPRSRRQSRAIGRNPHAFAPAEHNFIIRERNATAAHYRLLIRAQAQLSRARRSGDNQAISRASRAYLAARFFPEKTEPRLRHSVLSNARQRELRLKHEELAA
jgi:hypothetical protein